MNKWILTCLLLLFFYSCKDQEKEKENAAIADYLPVTAFIKSQVAHVDTSLYSIMRLTIYDSSRTDTDYIRREDFREAAKDFLSLPDLTDPSIGKNYD
jgi:hypothetical protein